jgi:uncharacterized phage protein gp47/JayE
VLFVRDNDPSIIPDSGEVAAMQTHLEALAPVLATVIAMAPTAVAFEPEIILTPDTPTNRAAVEAQLADLLAATAIPGGSLAPSQISEAISAAAGELYHTLVSPTAPVTTMQHEMLVMGTVTWS